MKDEEEAKLGHGCGSKPNQTGSQMGSHARAQKPHKIKCVQQFLRMGREDKAAARAQQRDDCRGEKVTDVAGSVGGTKKPDKAACKPMPGEAASCRGDTAAYEQLQLSSASTSQGATTQSVELEEEEQQLQQQQWLLQKRHGPTRSLAHACDNLSGDTSDYLQGLHGQQGRQDAACSGDEAISREAGHGGQQPADQHHHHAGYLKKLLQQPPQTLLANMFPRLALLSWLCLRLAFLVSRVDKWYKWLPSFFRPRLDEAGAASMGEATSPDASGGGWWPAAEGPRKTPPEGALERPGLDWAYTSRAATWSPEDLPESHPVGMVLDRVHKAAMQSIMDVMNTLPPQLGQAGVSKSHGSQSPPAALLMAWQPADAHEEEVAKVVELCRRLLAAAEETGAAVDAVKQLASQLEAAWALWDQQLCSSESNSSNLGRGSGSSNGTTVSANDGLILLRAVATLGALCCLVQAGHLDAATLLPGMIKGQGGSNSVLRGQLCKELRHLLVLVQHMLVAAQQQAHTWAADIAAAAGQGMPAQQEKQPGPCLLGPMESRDDLEVLNPEAVHLVSVLVQTIVRVDGVTGESVIGAAAGVDWDNWKAQVALLKEQQTWIEAALGCRDKVQDATALPHMCGQMGMWGSPAERPDISRLLLQVENLAAAWVAQSAGPLFSSDAEEAHQAVREATDLMWDVLNVVVDTERAYMATHRLMQLLGCERPFQWRGVRQQHPPVASCGIAMPATMLVLVKLFSKGCLDIRGLKLDQLLYGGRWWLESLLMLLQRLCFLMGCIVDEVEVVIATQPAAHTVGEAGDIPAATAAQVDEVAAGWRPWDSDSPSAAHSPAALAAAATTATTAVTTTCDPVHLGLLAPGERPIETTLRVKPMATKQQLVGPALAADAAAAAKPSRTLATAMPCEPSTSTGADRRLETEARAPKAEVESYGRQRKGQLLQPLPPLDVPTRMVVRSRQPQQCSSVAPSGEPAATTAAAAAAGVDSVRRDTVHDHGNKLDSVDAAGDGGDDGGVIELKAQHRPSQLVLQPRRRKAANKGDRLGQQQQVERQQQQAESTEAGWPVDNDEIYSRREDDRPRGRQAARQPQQQHAEQEQQAGQLQQAEQQQQQVERQQQVGQEQQAEQQQVESVEAGRGMAGDESYSRREEPPLGNDAVRDEKVETPSASVKKLCRQRKPPMQQAPPKRLKQQTEAEASVGEEALENLPASQRKLEKERRQLVDACKVQLQGVVFPTTLEQLFGLPLADKARELAQTAKKKLCGKTEHDQAEGQEREVEVGLSDPHAQPVLVAVYIKLPSSAGRRQGAAGAGAASASGSSGGGSNQAAAVDAGGACSSIQEASGTGGCRDNGPDGAAAGGSIRNDAALKAPPGYHPAAGVFHPTLRTAVRARGRRMPGAFIYRSLKDGSLKCDPMPQTLTALGLAARFDFETVVYLRDPNMARQALPLGYWRENTDAPWPPELPMLPMPPPLAAQQQAQELPGTALPGRLDGGPRPPPPLQRQLQPPPPQPQLQPPRLQQQPLQLLQLWLALLVQQRQRQGLAHGQHHQPLAERRQELGQQQQAIDAGGRTALDPQASTEVAGTRVPAADGPRPGQGPVPAVLPQQGQELTPFPQQEPQLQEGADGRHSGGMCMAAPQPGQQSDEAAASASRLLPPAAETAAAREQLAGAAAAAAAPADQPMPAAAADCILVPGVTEGDRAATADTKCSREAVAGAGGSTNTGAAPATRGCLHVHECSLMAVGADGSGLDAAAVTRGNADGAAAAAAAAVASEAMGAVAMETEMEANVDPEAAAADGAARNDGAVAVAVAAAAEGELGMGTAAGTGEEAPAAASVGQLAAAAARHEGVPASTAAIELLGVRSMVAPASNLELMAAAQPGPEAAASTQGSFELVAAPMVGLPQVPTMTGFGDGQEAAATLAVAEPTADSRPTSAAAAGDCPVEGHSVALSLAAAAAAAVPAAEAAEPVGGPKAVAPTAGVQAAGHPADAPAAAAVHPAAAAEPPWNGAAVDSGTAAGGPTGSSAAQATATTMPAAPTRSCLKRRREEDQGQAQEGLEQPQRKVSRVSFAGVESDAESSSSSASDDLPAANGDAGGGGGRGGGDCKGGGGGHSTSGGPGPDNDPPGAAGSGGSGGSTSQDDGTGSRFGASTSLAGGSGGGGAGTRDDVGPMSPPPATAEDVAAAAAQAAEVGAATGSPLTDYPLDNQSAVALWRSLRGAKMSVLRCTSIQVKAPVAPGTMTD